MTDNELIAEFMDEGFIREKNWHRIHWKDMPFNSSWDWLMPVVEKIAKIETKDIVRNGKDSYFDSYFPRTFGMINSETKEFMVRINRNPLHQSDSLIKATHEAVVEFIKWYNQNK